MLYFRYFAKGLFIFFKPLATHLALCWAPFRLVWV